ncbi:MAG: tRNA pseudouridine(38-40) synthase TruA [Brevefilum sp.]|nr:tRNA pseudouridine(38-40) synthase TruA [Brevefilum sp.]
MGLAHYKIILAYNGSAFAGFQRQVEARTVQAEFEEALRKIGWEGTHILGAGRTDAGVHARGQVVSFQLDWRHTPEDLGNALNYYLPREMAVNAVSEVATDFHPRYDARSRRYCYRIFCQPVRDPLREDFAWRIWPPVQLERMNQAVAHLVGVHDFRAFGSPMTEDGATVREVFNAEWTGAADEYQFDISANAYLYHMVRRITFALVTIGQGEAEESLILESLTSGELTLTGLAPAAGLVLQEVVY